MNGGQTFSGSGFVCCAGVSTRGEVFRLQDPNAFGATIADLVATGAEAETLRSLSDTMTVANVAGTIISTPGAVRPEVMVTSVSAAAPSPAPAPAPSPQPERYIDCVARCIGEKVPGLAVEDVVNSVCGSILLALGENPATVTASSPVVTALALCLSLTFGLTVGAVLECLSACWLARPWAGWAAEGAVSLDSPPVRRRRRLQPGSN